jgi:hypothetical protein
MICENGTISIRNAQCTLYENMENDGIYGAWEGESKALYKYLRIRAGTYPPPPMAIMRFGRKSLRICSADF